MKKVKVFAPATVANVCCGFDVLGFCMQDPADEVTLTLRHSPGIVMNRITGDGGKLSTDPKKNTAGVAVQSYLNAIQNDQGVEIDLVKNLPLGSGMGSSAASAVAAVVGINALLGEPLARKDLIAHVMEAERMACGSAHADNAAPCLMGGFVLIRDYHPLDVVQVPAKVDLFCSLIHPHMELKTADSRKVLRGSITLKDSITQSGNIAALMIGLIQADYDLIGRSLHDVIAEPTRSAFIPGFDIIKKEVMQSGALGFGISGSGPTVFALSKDQSVAEQCGVIATRHFSQVGLPSSVYISRVNKAGARIEG
ncbi:MAG TPA: homoserine kinase [Cyclobacteriaceae bacterium]|nr:homoserine kinase [Cyclobacteriaceae bacterium]